MGQLFLTTSSTCCNMYNFIHFMIYFSSFFLSSECFETNQTDICEEWAHWHGEAKCELTTARFDNRSLNPDFSQLCFTIMAELTCPDMNCVKTSERQ